MVNNFEQMKILYFFPYDGTYMTEWQRVQVFDELAHYDINFDIFNPLDFNSIEECNETLIKRLKEDKSIDLFFNCLGKKYLYVDTMKEIAKFSIPKVLVCFDNLHVPYMHKDIAQYFDLVWLTSWETEYIFKGWGCNTIFMPYASNPFVFRNKMDKVQNRVCFVGTPYGMRSIYFNALGNDNVDVDIYCLSRTPDLKKTQEAGSIIPLFFNNFEEVFESLSFPIGRKVIWSRLKKAVSKPQPLLDSSFIHLLPKIDFEEMNSVYSNYSLSLNITALRNTAILKKPVHKLHLRTFEIPMSYGLEFTERNSELSNYFSEEEMVFFGSPEEMVEKAKFFVSPHNESIVREYKINARKKAESEHCWRNRYECLFNKLGLKHFNLSKQ